MTMSADTAQGLGRKSFGPVNSRRLTIWASLGLICVAAVAALMLMQGIGRQLGDISETFEVRTAARELTHALSQAEASQRGYLLTQERQFVENYEVAVSGIDRRVDALIEMTADDFEQSWRVQSIVGDIAGKLAEMSRTVELVQSERTEEAQRLIESGMGARLMSEVNQTLEDFIAEEDQRLMQRNITIEHTRFGLVGALIAALVAAAILAHALLARTQRQMSVLALQQRGLLTQKEALELQVTERTRDIEDARLHAERERERVETLLRDANHRIGNSLATVSSLLALQMLRAHSDDIRLALEAARLRVHAIASAHRRLRLGSDLDSAGADDFLQAVLDDIASTQSDRRRITIKGDIAPIEVAARDATTVGILTAELVTNALKHAFPGDRHGTIEVRLFRRDDDVVMLEVSDDGIGIAEDRSVGDGGLGSVIVKQLSGQFGGEPHYQKRAEGGLLVSIALPNLTRPAVSSPEH